VRPPLLVRCDNAVLASTAPRISETSACGRFVGRAHPKRHCGDAEFVAPQEHLIELLRAHFVGSTWIGESLLARVTPVAIENEADMFGHKSGADLSTQSALIQPIEEVRHAMTGDARAGAIVDTWWSLSASRAQSTMTIRSIQPFRSWIICGRTMSWRPTSRRSVDSAGSSVGATAQKRHCRRKRHPAQRARMPHRGDHRFESPQLHQPIFDFVACPSIEAVIPLDSEWFRQSWIPRPALSQELILET